jgi:hypothetical protein
LAGAAEKISQCAGEISRQAAGGEHARNLLEEVADDIEVSGCHLVTAGGAIVAGRAIEAAWSAGAEHGRAGRPPVITDEDEFYAWHGEDASELAASLTLPAGHSTHSETWPRWGPQRTATPTLR